MAGITGADSTAAANPAVANPDDQEELSWTRWAMLMLMMLPTTAAPTASAAQGDWKERLERFNAAASDASEDEVRLRATRTPCALACEG